MAHPAQSSRNSMTVHRAQRVYGPSGYGDVTTDAQVQIVEAHGRDKSHKNPKDSNGWRAPSAYYGYYYQGFPGWSSIVSNDGRYGFLNKPWPLSSWLAEAYTASYPSHLTDSAYQRALLKFKQRHLNLAVSVAEIRETRQLLRDTILRCIEVANAVRKRVLFRTLRRLAKDPWNLWLEYRYGWRPFIADLVGARDALEARLAGNLDISKRTVRARNFGERSSRTTLYSNWAGHSFPWFLMTIERHESFKFNCRVRMDGTVLDSSFIHAVDYGYRDPFLVLWDLVPYSWMVDWFLGVGKWLDGLNALDGIQYRGGSQTMWYTRHREIVMTNHSGGRLTQWIPPKDTLTRFDRTVIVNPQSKLVWYGLDRIGWPEYADVLAVLAQKMRTLFSGKSGPHLRHH